MQLLDKGSYVIYIYNKYELLLKKYASDIGISGVLFQRYNRRVHTLHILVLNLRNPKKI
jgi:hypothetical protein